MKFLREPLLHFTIAGAVLFGGYVWLNQGGQTSLVDEPIRIGEGEVRWPVIASGTPGKGVAGFARNLGGVRKVTGLSPVLSVNLGLRFVDVCDGPRDLTIAVARNRLTMDFTGRALLTWA
jgi:hypothetical protein